MSKHRLGLLVCVGLFCGATWAHTHLESTSPKDKSTVSSPSELKLEFEEDVQVTAVSVQAADGVKQTLKVTPAKAKLIALPLGPLAPGAYVVSWRALGDDGHVMSGKFTFTVTAKQ